MNKLVNKPIRDKTGNFPTLHGHLNGLFIFGSLYLKAIAAKFTEAKVMNTNKLVKLATKLRSPSRETPIHNNIKKKIAT